MSYTGIWYNIIVYEGEGNFITLSYTLNFDSFTTTIIEASFSLGLSLQSSSTLDIPDQILPIEPVLTYRWDIYPKYRYLIPEDEVPFYLAEDFFITRKMVRQQNNFTADAFSVYSVDKNPLPNTSPLKFLFNMYLPQTTYLDHIYSYEDFVVTDKYIITPLFYDGSSPIAIIGSRVVFGKLETVRSKYYYTSIVVSDVINKRHQEIIKLQDLNSLHNEVLDTLSRDYTKDKDFEIKHKDNYSLPFWTESSANRFYLHHLVMYGDDEIEFIVSSREVYKDDEDIIGGDVVSVTPKPRYNFTKTLKLFLSMAESEPDSVNATISFDLNLRSRFVLTRRRPMAGGKVTYRFKYKRQGTNWIRESVEYYPYIYMYGEGLYLSEHIFYYKIYDCAYLNALERFWNYTQPKERQAIKDLEADTQLYYIWKPKVEGGRIIPYGKPILYNPNIYNLSNLPSDYILTVGNNQYIVCSSVSKRFFGIHTEVNCSNLVNYIPKKWMIDGYPYEYQLFRIAQNKVTRRTVDGYFTLEVDGTFSRTLPKTMLPIIYWSYDYNYDFSFGGLYYNSNLEVNDPTINNVVNIISSYRSSKNLPIGRDWTLYFCYPDLYIMFIRDDQSYCVFVRGTTVLGHINLYGTPIELFDRWQYTPEVFFTFADILKFDGRFIYLFSRAIFGYETITKIDLTTLTHEIFVTTSYNESFAIFPAHGLTRSVGINQPTNHVVVYESEYLNKYFLNHFSACFSKKYLNEIVIYTMEHHYSFNFFNSSSILFNYYRHSLETVRKISTNTLIDTKKLLEGNLCSTVELQVV